MDVSVVLCTFNRCGLLGTALDSLAASVMPDGITWEILVVDNNSKDRTRDVVAEFSRRYPERFRYLFEARAGKSFALNAGIAASKGAVVAFVDDDVTVASDWLENLTAPLRRESLAGTGGRVVPQWTSDPPKWLARNSWAIAGPLVSFDRGEKYRPLEESPVGTNMAFARRVFEQYGGFRVDLGPTPDSEIRNEDSEFARRLFRAEERLYYVPQAVVYHPVTENRLTKRYFQTWWFDKARSEIREAGVPKEAGRMFQGIPLPMFRRLLRWILQWLITVNPRNRFECKLRAWYTAGVITESHRRFKVHGVRAEVAVGDGPS